MNVSKGKMWSATLGGCATFLVLVGGFLADGRLDGQEMATGAGALVTLVSTVYAVWRKPNVPIGNGVRPLSR